MYINPNVFLIIKDGELVVWDYANHQQFEIESIYLDRLLFWSKNPQKNSVSTEPLTSIDQELLDGNLLLTEQPEESTWGWDVLSHIFHQGTSNVSEDVLTRDQWIEQYVGYCQEIAQTPPPARLCQSGITLPEPDHSTLQKASLYDAFYNRKTCRSFYGQEMSLENLSALLYFSFGVIHKEWPDLAGLKQIGFRKAFPAGGGLHAEEIYVVIYRVAGVQPGVYHYDCHNHVLSPIEEGFFEQKVVDLLSSQYFAEGLSIGIFMTSCFDQYWWKYQHSRGYRPAVLDIGHASQTFLLTATALGLQTWLTGAFSDQGVREFLNLTKESECPLFFVGAGYGSNESIPPSIRAYLNQ